MTDPNLILAYSMTTLAQIILVIRTPGCETPWKRVAEFLTLVASIVMLEQYLAGFIQFPALQPPSQPPAAIKAAPAETMIAVSNFAAMIG